MCYKCKFVCVYWFMCVYYYVVIEYERNSIFCFGVVFVFDFYKEFVGCIFNVYNFNVF